MCQPRVWLSRWYRRWYNQSELLSERKAALERWSAHVGALISGGTDNVVALQPRQMGAA